MKKRIIIGHICKTHDGFGFWVEFPGAPRQVKGGFKTRKTAGDGRTEFIKKTPNCKVL